MACETSLEDIQGNEWVCGLQRAFKIAGAKYLIMYIWQVPDRKTMEFMTAFYKYRLEGNMSIPDAFRTTQRAMRDRFFNPYSGLDLCWSNSFLKGWHLRKASLDH